MTTSSSTSSVQITRERVAQARLEVFLDSSDLMPMTQSAYHRFHSTETAVMKVYTDLLLAADNGDVSALCLLDLTAAFDTVDHDLMMLKHFAVSFWIGSGHISVAEPIESFTVARGHVLFTLYVPCLRVLF